MSQLNGLFYKTSTYNELFKYVKEDFYPAPDLFFVTFTLSPKLFKYNAITQYEMTICELQYVLNNQLSQYTLTTELTEAGNVHYHALIIIESKLTKMRLIEHIKKKRCLGFMKITPAAVCSEESLIRSVNYLIKDLNTTQKIIQRPNYKPDLLLIKNMR